MNNALHCHAPGLKLLNKRNNAIGKARFASAFGDKATIPPGIRAVAAAVANITWLLLRSMDLARKYIKTMYNRAKETGTHFIKVTGLISKTCESCARWMCVTG